MKKSDKIQVVYIKKKIGGLKKKSKKERVKKRSKRRKEEKRRRIEKRGWREWGKETKGNAMERSRLTSKDLTVE